MRSKMRYIVFLIAYIYFLIIDIRKQRIDMFSLVIYAILALFAIAYDKNNIDMARFVDLIYSVLFGLVIYFLSYFSEEGIGLADGIYFVINGFLLTLKENIILFLTGLLVAFIIGIFLFYFGNQKSRESSRLPFMPCFLPAILGYIICIA